MPTLPYVFLAISYRDLTSPKEQPSRDVEHGKAAAMQFRPSSHDQAGEDDDPGDNGTVYRDVLLDTKKPYCYTDPLYLGDANVLSLVLDICQHPRPSHYMVPRGATRPLSPEESTFIEAGGCYSFPDKEICERLTQAYFKHIHPNLPIMEAGRFIARFRDRGTDGLNLLLMWSMFFAASSFADENLVKGAGYISRKAMKRAFFKRAKILYDIDYERDKIILIQSVILLSHWFVDSEDRNGPWYWIGIAISLAHTMGLHRSLKHPSQTDTRDPGIHQSLWRSIWWSCYFREVWISYGMGRPMRIHSNDVDVPMPTVDDIMRLSTVEDRPELQEYLPRDMSSLAVCWIKHLHIAICISKIQYVHYEPTKENPTTTDIAKHEHELLQCFGAHRISDPTASMELQLATLQIAVTEQ
ncbi:hypothetical protein AYO21_01399 [Fonsecaea monophora]|uniref:Xylanolytic transcriptional activator regulatory domain-containing protein n=1 Tax=Fonsecaea monophora TaxID=254056 RepID=A0A177FJA5_9EURO|nr:hypothetical protein AYO21_01399 [Fonsecaea monophora]KAH0845928.1 hypothetical protein FOPE_11640 [Fonsecaea pedrosoi]OAG44403.1 hypothetical protein AYO21_01399 [Fonsecaea monophora]